MFYPCTAIVRFPVRSTALVALLLACSWSARAQSQPLVGTKNDRLAAVPQSVEVSGKVVDAETGKPVEAFINQAGKFETMIRLKRGRTLRGRVLDDLGKPVRDASRNLPHRRSAWRIPIRELAASVRTVTLDRLTPRPSRESMGDSAIARVS
jgi:hypothetical protein